MQIFICGDSTAASYNPEETQMVGWGQLLGNHLPAVTVVNLAMAGRSTKTFLQEHRLDPVSSKARPGDLMLVQFAHNDENEKKPERYVPLPAFRENLSTFVRFARELKLIPVLLTPICMRVWQGGVLQPTHGEYPAAAAAVADSLSVPLIDLYTESFRIVSALGEECSKGLFMPDDIAHTRFAGADRFAVFAADGLKRKGLIPGS
jgi:lysophospholipase L1-like esterase